MVKPACESGSVTGKPISVCNEAGGNPLLASVLAGLGMSSLSMASKKVPVICTVLRLHGRVTCQQTATYAIDAETAADAKTAVAALVDPKVKNLLQSNGISTKPGVHMQPA